MIVFHHESEWSEPDCEPSHSGQKSDCISFDRRKHVFKISSKQTIIVNTISINAIE